MLGGVNVAKIKYDICQEICVTIHDICRFFLRFDKLEQSKKYCVYKSTIKNYECSDFHSTFFSTNYALFVMQHAVGECSLSNYSVHKICSEKRFVM